MSPRWRRPSKDEGQPSPEDVDKNNTTVTINPVGFKILNGMSNEFYGVNFESLDPLHAYFLMKQYTQGITQVQLEKEGMDNDSAEDIARLHWADEFPLVIEEPHCMWVVVRDDSGESSIEPTSEPASPTDLLTLSFQLDPQVIDYDALVAEFQNRDQ